LVKLSWQLQDLEQFVIFTWVYRSILIDALLDWWKNLKHQLVLKVFDLVSQGTETYQMKLK
jgi:hypothetical protein